MNIYIPKSNENRHYVPYTYLIGWTKLNIWYYGLQTATGGKQKRKIAHPTNLWTTYFTSSKIVKLFRKTYGEPDVVQIRRTFTTRESALAWERKVLTRMRVIKSDKWLNQACVSMDGSKSSKEWMKTPAGKELMKQRAKQFKENNPNWQVWNKGLTKETNEQLKKTSERVKMHMEAGILHCIGDSMRGRKVSQEHRQKLKDAAHNRDPMVWVSNDTICISTKIKVTSLQQYLDTGWIRGRRYGYESPFKNPRPKLTCPYCHKTGVDNNMKRYHFDNCKLHFST